MAASPTFRSKSIGTRLRARVTADARVLFGTAWRTVRDRRLAAAPLALLCGIAVLAMAWLDHRAWGSRWIAKWATEYAGSSWSWFFVRLVPSIFAPTELLPFWLAWIQVTIVIASCEVVIGWRRTALAGFACHALATMSARLFIDVGPGWLLGVAESFRFFGDTGPSAATMGLGMYISMIKRTPTLFVILLAYAVVESIARWGLAQREHAVAIAVGLGLGAIDRAIVRRHSPPLAAAGAA